MIETLTMSLQHMNPPPSHCEDNEFSSLSPSPLQRTRKTHSIRRSSVETEDQEILATYSPAAAQEAAMIHHYSNNTNTNNNRQRTQHHHHHTHQTHQRQDSEDTSNLLKAIEAYEALEEEAAKSEACYPLEEELDYDDQSSVNSSNLSINHNTEEEHLFDFFEDYSRDSPPETYTEKVIIREIKVQAPPNLQQASMGIKESSTTKFPLNSFNSMKISGSKDLNRKNQSPRRTAIE
mmetsp:Transcript_18943/g.26718  ORF Transcript_18943/g.26718 Transcript_18943/m.26718 type:complete len:235 (+) Transcript_18943:2377-3081(+)